MHWADLRALIIWIHERAVDFLNLATVTGSSNDKEEILCAHLRSQPRTTTRTKSRAAIATGLVIYTQRCPPTHSLKSVTVCVCVCAVVGFFLCLVVSTPLASRCCHHPAQTIPSSEIISAPEHRRCARGAHPGDREHGHKQEHRARGQERAHPGGYPHGRACPDLARIHRCVHPMVA